jgi:hypothetical protein
MMFAEPPNVNFGVCSITFHNACNRLISNFNIKLIQRNYAVGFFALFVYSEYGHFGIKKLGISLNPLIHMQTEVFPSPNVAYACICLYVDGFAL